MRTFPVLALAVAIALFGGACTPDGATPMPDATSAQGPASAAPLAVASPLPVASAAATSTPTPTLPTPSPTPAPIAEADAEPFAMNLAERDDFVAQYTFDWCVGASLQMAVNMAKDERRTSRADQERLWELARDRSSSPFGGVGPGYLLVLPVKQEV
ncbi:hypothetical protein BH20CHL7_BH20CHL7_03620 [soil metagenome]